MTAEARLETERLVLRPARMSDAPRIQALFPVWDIVQFLPHSVPWPYPADGAEKFLTFMQSQMLLGHEIMWAITLKAQADDQLVGAVSLRDRDSGTGHLGFWLGMDYQGNGYMTEAVAAVLAFARDVAGMESLIVKNALQNTGSSRVQQKSGARLLRTETECDYRGGFSAQEVWEIRLQKTA